MHGVDLHTHSNISDGTLSPGELVSAAIQQGINIVDLGGQVGKVLVMRGKTSTYNVGTAMGDGYAGAWFNMNFYFDKILTPIRETVRVRLVFSIHENVISATGSALGKLHISPSRSSITAKRRGN